MSLDIIPDVTVINPIKGNVGRPNQVADIGNDCNNTELKSGNLHRARVSLILMTCAILRIILCIYSNLAGSMGIR